MIEDFKSGISVTTAPKEYIFQETSGIHTDIQNSAAYTAFSDFGLVGVSTTLQYEALGQEWLQRASCRFHLTFGSARNTAILHFFSPADELSYRRALYESAASSTMPATSRPVLPASKSEENDDLRGLADLPSQVCDWLGITYGQLATITGISRASFFNWREPGFSPRPNNLQRIQRLHATISLLVRRFGSRGARTWLLSGDNPVWDLLMAGDMLTAENEIRSRLFVQPASKSKYNALPLDEVSLDIPATDAKSGRTPRRSGRQPSKRQRGTSD